MRGIYRGIPRGYRTESRKIRGSRVAPNPGGSAAVSRYFCAERDAREMQKYVPPVGRQPLLPSTRGTSRRGAVRICFASRTPLENGSRSTRPPSFGLLEIANVSFRNVNPFFPSGKSSGLADTCSGASTRTENCGKCKNTCSAHQSMKLLYCLRKFRDACLYVYFAYNVDFMKRARANFI